MSVLALDTVSKQSSLVRFHPYWYAFKRGSRILARIINGTALIQWCASCFSYRCTGACIWNKEARARRITASDPVVQRLEGCRPARRSRSAQHLSSSRPRGLTTKSGAALARQPFHIIYHLQPIPGQHKHQHPRGVRSHLSIVLYWMSRL